MTGRQSTAARRLRPIGGGRAAATRASARAPHLATEARLLRELAAGFVHPFTALRQLNDAILLYRQLAQLLGAGIPLARALEIRASSPAAGSLRAPIAAAFRRVVEGGRLSDALAEYPWIVPAVQVEVLRVGEAAGRLDVVAAQLADTLERELALRRFLNRQTLYPKIVLVVATAVLPAIMAFIFGGSVLGAVLPAIVQFFWLCLLVCVALALSWTAMYRSSRVAEAYEAVIFALPCVGTVARAFATSRFTDAFAMLHGAGVSMPASLRTAGNASGSVALARAANHAAADVECGTAASAALAATGAFPPRTLDMLRTGEQSGRVDEMMRKNAEYLADEAETKSQKVSYLIAQFFYLWVALYVTGLLSTGTGSAIVRLAQ